MGDPRAFGCGDIRASVRPFLDDLLSEEEYRAFCRHLETCGACRDYVSSIGSLANQVYELGQSVEAPPDLVSTVLFRLTAPPRQVPWKMTAAVIVAAVALAVLILSVSSGFIGKKRVVSKRAAQPAERAEQPETVEVMMGESFGGVSPSVPAVPDPAAVAPMAEIPAQAEKPVPVAPLKPLHWHIAVKDKAAEDKLIKTFEGLGIQPDYRFGPLLVIRIAAEDVDRIRAGVAIDSGVGDFTPSSRAEKGTRRLSIFFDRKNEAAVPRSDGSFISMERAADACLHWHILLVLPKKEEVFGLVRSEGGIREYESEEMDVFSLPSNAVAPLVARVRAMEGVFVDADEKAIEQLPAGEKVKLSLYFPEK